MINIYFHMTLLLFCLGNIKQGTPFGLLIIQQNKNGQRMGNTLFSSGEFFVVSISIIHTLVM